MTCTARVFACVVALFTLAAHAAAQGVVVGVVRDASGRPRAGVQVDSSSDGTSWGRLTATNAAGAFEFRGEAKRLLLRFSHPTTDTLQVAVNAVDGHELRLTVSLEAGMLLASAREFRVGIRSIPSSRFFSDAEPNYFITGFDGTRDSVDRYVEQVKFRVALRYRLSGLGGSYDSGLYVLFLQNSFWHILTTSAPFWDNNYNPGVMLYYDGREDSRVARALRLPRQLSAGLIVEHESNGRDGDRSRSWNRVAARVDWGDDEEDLAVVRAKGWHVLSLDEKYNPDLPDRAGRGELVLELRPMRDGDGTRSMGLLGLQVKSRLFGSRVLSNVEASAFWLPRRIPVLRSLNSSLMLQYFRGRAENLVDHRQSREVIRIGIATVR